MLRSIFGFFAVPFLAILMSGVTRFPAFWVLLIAILSFGFLLGRVF